jgi:hypothetical protein
MLDASQRDVIRAREEEREHLQIFVARRARERLGVGDDAVEQRRRETRRHAIRVGREEILRGHGRARAVVRAHVAEARAVRARGRMMVDHGRDARQRIAEVRRLDIDEDERSKQWDPLDRHMTHALVQLGDQPLILGTRDLSRGDDRRARGGEAEGAAKRKRGGDRVRIRIVLHEEGASRRARERTLEPAQPRTRGWIRAHERSQPAVNDVAALSSRRHLIRLLTLRVRSG